MCLLCVTELKRKAEGYAQQAKTDLTETYITLEDLGKADPTDAEGGDADDDVPGFMVDDKDDSNKIPRTQTVAMRQPLLALQKTPPLHRRSHAVKRSSKVQPTSHPRRGFPLPQLKMSPSGRGRHLGSTRLKRSTTAHSVARDIETRARIKSM